MEMKRISRSEMWMRVAAVVAMRGTCPRLQTGAVITTADGRNLLSLGCNGAPPKAAHCIDVGCFVETVRERERCVRTVHAEVNAILRLEDIHMSLSKIMFCTHKPCFECVKVLKSAGIEWVLFQTDYEDPFADQLADEYGINLVYFDTAIEMSMLPEVLA